jgi:predicted transcriptional regulator
MKNYELEDLHDAIKTKNVLKVGLIAFHLPRNLIAKETLKLSIGSQDRWITKLMSEMALENCFDKELLNQAIETKSPSIVYNISKKTPKKFFDSDILSSSIKTNLEEIYKNVSIKTEQYFYNKEILKTAIENKNQEILNDVAAKSNVNFFDFTIMERALKTKNPDTVRTISNYTTDIHVFSKYKEQIAKSILSEQDIKNFTAQILSRADNTSFDVEMQETILDIYMDVILKNFKKGSIPKNFPMVSFEKSVQQSRFFFSYPDGINFESLKEKNRFLILPIYSYGHAFSAIVRKADENDKYSVTFINLGARPFEVSGKGNSYKEYIYKKDDALNVLKNHCYNVRLHYPQRSVTTQKAYRNFSEKALEEYTINVVSRDQKVGNCFLKNIEKGLRYALALGLSKLEDHKFSEESLRVTEQSGQKLKVKFLKPIHKNGDKTNNLTTLGLRQELIIALSKRFPEYEKTIMKEWNIYKNRKEKTVNFSPVIPPIRLMKTKEDSPVFHDSNGKDLKRKSNYSIKTQGDNLPKKQQKISQPSFQI